MLWIGADVGRTSGNDLLAFKTNRETEVSEPRTDLAEARIGFSTPDLLPSLPPRNTCTSTHTPPRREPRAGRCERPPGRPLLSPLHSRPRVAPSGVSSASPRPAGYRPAGCRPHHIWPRSLALPLSSGFAPCVCQAVGKQGAATPRGFRHCLLKRSSSKSPNHIRTESTNA